MLLRIALILLSLAYPLLVLWGQHWFEPASLSPLLLVLAWLRARKLSTGRFDWLWPVGLVLLALWTLKSNSSLPLKLYPIAVSLSFLLLFSWSLKVPPSMIERFARLQTPELPPEAIAYTRKVTQVWCGFFVLNASISGWTLYYGTDAQWALYNGGISYLLMGLLFGIEWLVRPRPATTQPTDS